MTWNAGKAIYVFGWLRGCCFINFPNPTTPPPPRAAIETPARVFFLSPPALSAIESIDLNR